MMRKPDELDGYITDANDALRHLQALAEAFASAEESDQVTGNIYVTHEFRNELVRLLILSRAVFVEELTE